MRIITCAGFYATGSSAVTDFFGEFDNIHSLDNYEYRFPQDPDGIADLEYNIVENNHRHNTSHAIKRFIKLMKSYHGFGYRHSYDVFGKQFDILTNKYINDITELKSKSWWIFDRHEKGKVFTVSDMGYSFIKRILNGGLKTEKRYSMLTKGELGYYSAISEKEFLEATRKFTTSLFQSVNKDDQPYVMADQLVPPVNASRYVRYFDDIKVIVVDRDPRDVYLVEKTKIQRGVIPVDNVEDYVKWFKITRRYSEKNEISENIMRIRFEDLIYNYDVMSEELCKFVGLDRSNHVRVKELFDPDRSIRNSNLKKKIKGYEKDIKYIEEELADYLYDF